MLRSYLSPAPHALPQAAGFSSGLSAAPQAAGASEGLSPAPQAAGLSDAPQALPAVFSFHPAIFANAMIIYLLLWDLFQTTPLLFYDSDYTGDSYAHKYAPFCNHGVTVPNSYTMVTFFKLWIKQDFPPKNILFLRF